MDTVENDESLEEWIQDGEIRYRQIDYLTGIAIGHPCYLFIKVREEDDNPSVSESIIPTWQLEVYDPGGDMTKSPDPMRELRQGLEFQLEPYYEDDE